MTKQERIAANLEEAQEWEDKKNLAGAQNAYRFAVTESLSIGISEYSTKEAALKFFERTGLVQLLEKMLELNRLLLVEVAEGKYSRKIIGGLYDLIVFAHLCWLLSQYKLSESFLELAAHEDMQKGEGKFWPEYYRAITHLRERKAYSPVTLALRSLERYWVTYLYVISDITSGRDPSATIAEMRHSFKKKNEDKRIKDDLYEIEGTVLCPAKWDFRGESILTYANELYGMNLS